MNKSNHIRESPGIIYELLLLILNARYRLNLPTMVFLLLVADSTSALREEREKKKRRKEMY